jgi:GAF domain-containing protein
MVVITRDRFHIAACRGFTKEDIAGCKALVPVVPRLKSVMDYNELEYCVQKEKGECDVHFFDAFNSFFHNTIARLVVPLQSKARNLGFVVVGAKQADKMFTREDIVLLDTLGKQAAIAIDNALLYQALEKKNKRLYQLLNTQKEFLDIASHELRTPISIIRSASSILMQHREDILEQDDALARMNATVG